MKRTLISLDPEDKKWLDQQARARNIPMTELVRRAVRAYRSRQESLDKPDLQAALTQTAGIWRSGDGQAHQSRLREEWDERP